MKKVYLFILLGITFIAEIILSVVMINNNIIIKNDTVILNELTKEISSNYSDTTKYPNICDYVVIDNSGNVIYKTQDGMSETLNEAYQNGDTIIDIIIDGNVKGKIIVRNTFNDTRKAYTSSLMISIISIACIQLISLIVYYVYLYITIIKPFKNMRGFAERIAGGNLDIPLTMDRNNNFGAFTESFDIMRSELKKARQREALAEKSKRELVARLSHDIKTPVASIKSLSELGEAVASDEKSKKMFGQVNQKADQINTLVNNLFTITIEELEELSINPTNIPSYVVSELIDNSDYLNKKNDYSIPQCNVFVDRLRLQQVFDNIFANSYKYADTNIEVESKIEGEYLVVSVKDFGSSITDDELPLLVEKFRRGNNTENKDGAGLGLYISSRFMSAMNGKLEIYNDKPGFKVLIYLRII